MPDINFHSIAARCGSQSNAFEELCSQLARRTSTPGTSFERFHGAGGDGGVECIARLADGSATGWQAKFVFDVEALITQANDSLQTALSIHKNLKKYVVCFPFDPTGKTARTTRKGRPAKSQAEKLDAWVKKAVVKAKAAGRKLTIERWPASQLQSLLFQHDPSGGIRQYFFDETILSPDWFKNHLIAAAKSAEPRYTPELNVETDLWWNGTDGFATANGKTVFFDPQFCIGPPVALLADFDDLLLRLDKIGCRLVWTLLGEKWVLGDERRHTPRICYSQLAWLTDSGSVKVGQRRFFEDYEQDQGLAKLKD